jgi:hypothetical protein
MAAMSIMVSDVCTAYLDVVECAKCTRDLIANRAARQEKAAKTPSMRTKSLPTLATIFVILAALVAFAVWHWKSNPHTREIASHQQVVNLGASSFNRSILK